MVTHIRLLIMLWLIGTTAWCQEIINPITAIGNMPKGYTAKNSPAYTMAPLNTRYDYAGNRKTFSHDDYRSDQNYTRLEYKGFKSPVHSELYPELY